LPTFEEALAAEPERRAGRRICHRSVLPQSLLYREAAAFTEQVRRYFQVFGRDQVHVIIYDDFAAHTTETYRGALEFLGVAPDFLPADFKVVNGNKTVRSRLLRAIVHEPLVREAAVALGRRLPQGAFKFLQRLDVRLRRFNTRPEKRSAMAPEQRAELKREFAPEIERLSELLGRDLTHWSRTELS
jgi:hypothetical protein